MKRALAVAIVFGIATVALFVAPSFLFRVKTIGKHDVDLSKNGETVLPVPDVAFCCGSKLLLFLDSPVESDRNSVAKELLKPTNLVCEILTPDEETVPVKINNLPSWSGIGATKRLFLGSAYPPSGQGRFVRLNTVNGCSRLSGVRQTVVLRQTPCSMSAIFGSIPYFLGALVTGAITVIALIVTLVMFIKNKRFGKKQSSKAIEAS